MTQGWLRRLRSGGVGLAFALGLLAAGFLQLPHSSLAQQQGTAVDAVSPNGTAPAAGTASLLNLSEAFASVAEQVKPSVVYIKSGRNNQDERRDALRDVAKKHRA